jgi:hypothetical protein
MPARERLPLPLLFLILILTVVPALAADARLGVLYHVVDEEKVAFVLNNIQNHLDGGGPDKLRIVLVSHGPAVKRFVDIDAVERIRTAVARLQEQGVSFEACANTLRALGVEPDALLPGFSIAENGGVTRIAELQAQGHVYIRP